MKPASFLIYMGVFIGASCLATPAMAQNTATGSIDIVNVNMNGDAPTLTLTITGAAKSKPDIATISSGVSTKAVNAADAMAQNATVMTKLISAIKSKAIADKDIQTSSINLGQDYDYSGEKGPVFKGYEASNMVTVRLRDISKTGEIFDVMSKNGATNISGPNFSMENPEPLMEAARLDAMDKAAKQASFYAKAAGYKSARLLSIHEERDMGNIRTQIYDVREALADAPAPSTPVKPGEVTAAILITIKYALVK
jgi:hypothetical protein